MPNRVYTFRLSVEGIRQIEADLQALGNVLDMGDPVHPRVQQIKVPRRKLWNDVEERFDVVTNRRFMPDIFSTHHSMIRVPPSMLARRVGVVSMHDLNSGKRGVERFFDQVQSVLDFDDIDGTLRSQFNDRWVKAQTNHDRYRVMYDMEEEVLMPALAGKLGISEDLARTIFNKINTERERTFTGLTSGKGRQYEAGPTFAQRLEDESNTSARVVSGADEEGMLTIEFRDGQRLVTHLPAVAVRAVEHAATVQRLHAVDVRQAIDDAGRQQQLS